MKKRKPVFEVSLKIQVVVGTELLIHCLPAVFAFLKALVMILPRLNL